MIKKIKGWFTPSHKCTVFRHYLGINIKVCDYCEKEYPLANFILHQR